MRQPGSSHKLDQATLTELEGLDWGEPDYPSHLVVTCHEMRHKPIRELTDGEIRMAIGQQFSLPTLVPLALERLEPNPLLEADFDEGDLWKVVLLAKPDFWTEHVDLWQQANRMSQRAWVETAAMDESWQQTIAPDLKEAYDIFLLRKPD